MLRNILKSVFPVILLALLLTRCVTIDYVGRSYEPTNEIDVFYSKEEVKRDHQIIGHAVGSGSSSDSSEEILVKLENEARKRGADAMIISGITKSHAADDDLFSDKKNIQASFLKYE